MEMSLIFFALFTGAQVPAVGPPEKSPSLSSLLKGALRSTSLRTGMSPEQVERILGPTELLACHRGVSVRYASRLGVCVFFCYDLLSRVESEFFELLLRKIAFLIGPFLPCSLKEMFESTQPEAAKEHKQEECHRGSPSATAMFQ
jgi:hypothetical protein